MNRLDAVWRSFLKLSAGERREFVVMLRENLAARRAARRMERGTDAGYRYPPARFSNLTLDGADLEPSAIPDRVRNGPMQLSELTIGEVDFRR